MIYILTEQIMNGTVTIDTSVTGIEAVDFEEAKHKLKVAAGDNGIGEHGVEMENERDADDGFRYVIRGGTFPVVGRLSNKPLRMLDEKP